MTDIRRVTSVATYQNTDTTLDVYTVEDSECVFFEVDSLELAQHVKLSKADAIDLIARLKDMTDD